MKAAYDLLHRAEGELKYTAEIYGAICKRLERIDRLLTERSLVATDTVNQLKVEESIPPDASEPEDPCWDEIVKYAAPGDDATLRTVSSYGCDGGGMAYTTFEVITDFDGNGETLRIQDVTNEYLFDNPDGAGIINQGVSAKTTTYFDDGQPVYELLTSEHQGFEVFRRLTLLGE